MVFTYQFFEQAVSTEADQRAISLLAKVTEDSPFTIPTILSPNGNGMEKTCLEGMYSRKLTHQGTEHQGMIVLTIFASGTIQVSMQPIQPLGVLLHILKLQELLPEIGTGHPSPEDHGLLLYRMLENQVFGVQVDATVRVGLRKAVLHVTADGAAHAGQLHPDLVWPPRDGLYLYQPVIIEFA